MNEREQELLIRRILVALDVSPSSLAALEAAAELASLVGAELSGLFVEDMDLLRTAKLPFTRAVGPLSAALRDLESLPLEQGFRADASRARRALEEVARRAQVEWSFRVARGTVAQELLSAVTEADLVSIGRVGWLPRGQRDLGATAREILSRSPGSVLLARQGTWLRPPVLVVYDGTPGAGRALAAATRLAGEGLPLVIIPAKNPETAGRLREQVEGWLTERSLQARYRPLERLDEANLAQVLREERGGVLVLPARDALPQGETLADLLGHVGCPVLLIR